jgi:deferrochelatase/peroxidase EfeB
MTASGAVSASLELADIQGGVLHERPSPYVGTYLLLRVDDRAAGRELVRRLHPVVESGRALPDRAENAWVTVAFTYQGLRALGVPPDSLESFAPEFRQGMAARAAELGDVGESSPAHWEKPLGTSDVHVALAVLSPDRARLEAVLDRARLARSGGQRNSRFGPEREADQGWRVHTRLPGRDGKPAADADPGRARP